MPLADTMPARLIESLRLVPHPEGGHYVETHRGPPLSDGRASVTTIYYLLRQGERSHWHRIDASEVWHYQAGAPMGLEIARDGRIERVCLGSDLLGGEVGHAVVPPLAWQSARALGPWSLVSCTVSPGFVFEGLEMAPPGWSPPAATS
ncbi:MAG: cupin domain-containing protein [Geminicoccaceae bacterium]|nr:MAG: cupin domain-containing protein [Geminicoccaceae bacterium]